MITDFKYSNKLKNKIVVIVAVSFSSYYTAK
jgi:hypothetical protein